MMTIKNALQKGFTLIELMIALAVFGVLIAAGIPGMSNLLNNIDVSSTSDRLVNSLAYARGEAVARVANVTICASNDLRTCSGTWNDGWIVWADTNGDGAVVDSEINRAEENSRGTTIAGVGLPGTIVFSGLGESNNAADIVFTISKSGASTTKQVTVTPIGYTSIN